MYEGLIGYDRNQINIYFYILNLCYFMFYSDGISQNYLHTNIIFVLVLAVMKKQAFWLYPNFMSRGLKNSVYFSGLLQSIDGNCVE